MRDETTTTLKKKNPIRLLYDWVLSWADTRYGTPALFVVSFLDSTVFLIPPDVLQIALSAGRPRRSFWYATLSTAASVLGGLSGYVIGFYLWKSVSVFFFKYLGVIGFTLATFETVSEWYNTNAFMAVLLGAFSVFPYKVCTIAAGACEINVPIFIIASILGRGARFYLVAALMFFFGAPIKAWIEKYFNLLVFVFSVLLVGGFLLARIFVK
jgi:membrane protein YqaA with SNARE-associated domain